MEAETSNDYISVPNYGWKIPLTHKPKERREQKFWPKLKQILPLIGLALRYFWFSLCKMWSGKRPVMDYITMQHGKQIYGCPMGGIGAGSIGRGYRGEFCRFQMRPGMYEYNIVVANQFILTVHGEQNNLIFQQVLNPSQPPSKRHLRSWKWEMDAKCAKYTALYPRAWTEYDFTEKAGVKLICRQISPVIPHNYKDSSFPGAVFVWKVENVSSEIRHVSITLTFQNGNGTKSDFKGGAWSDLISDTQEDGIHGLAIHHDIDSIDYSYILAAKQKPNATVSRLIEFDPCGDGSELWTNLSNEGYFQKGPQKTEKRPRNKSLGAAINVRTNLKSGANSTLEFCLAWDQPIVHFPDSTVEYRRYYSKFWPGPRELITYALNNYLQWDKEIATWQSKVLNDKHLPKWFKGAIFNELYYIADGGSIWLQGEDESQEFGRFAYLEGHEYRMYNTYDVHFYASSALSQLWPRLQQSLQREVAHAVGVDIPERRWVMYGGGREARKKPGTVPHDLGDPEESPFEAINAYPIHDVADWRDLNTKFVLQVYRDYYLHKDKDHLNKMWPVCKKVLERTRSFDEDNDGLIENSGSPDQTYDSWVVQGASSYCGGLWLAALGCAVRMAEALKEPETVVQDYQKLLEKAKESFHKKLWNGKYYNYDSSSGREASSIMSDQLCGHWYLRMCGFQHEVFPKENVISALKIIFENNVKKFGEGRLGAVNGMWPDGKPDTTTIQSEEAWTGVTFALASLMLYEGLEDEAWETAGGLLDTIWNQIGMGFETPEALYEYGGYRSIGYMRPLSIWSMHQAWLSRNT